MARSHVRLKTLADAVELRNRVYGAFEQAERADDPATRDAWLTFVVIGGGATGVEMSGALASLAHHSGKRTFARIDPGRARVILLDAGDRVLPAFASTCRPRREGPSPSSASRSGTVSAPPRSTPTA